MWGDVGRYGTPSSRRGRAPRPYLGRAIASFVCHTRDCPLLFRLTTAAIAPLQGLDLDRDNATYVRCTKQALLPVISLLVTDDWYC